MGALPWLAVLLLFHSGPVKQTVDVVNEINQVAEEKRDIGKVTVEHWYSPHDHTGYGIDDEEIIETWEANEYIGWSENGKPVYS